ncbi:biotin-dependent carboxyltransferase family protein [Cutibacterium sp. WCA-380-WT-3A]|uniref:Biotin-dependent carboxyltransferase family protein n=1 Tax=Cutibacterium porci TaxID=2605781 RepID=A0A7K0J4X7_9ACTN|nr:biotin-dependent carboxyltransferase family protein [Cutibacterium porci]MSS44973.1 biotin-dependent carboxyltransferase family protein [Cutibacterium porci]
MTYFVVEAAGPRTLIEDAGRRGWADLGISGCGAWDRQAYLDGARLVGNGAGLGCLEVLLGPVRLRCVGGPVLVAVTGTDAQVHLDGTPRPNGGGFLVKGGQTVSISAPEHGLRSYVSVSGGIDATPTFSSVSADPTRGIGPAPLTPGDCVNVGHGRAGVISTTLVDAPQPSRELVLHGVWGPRDDWFTDASRHRLEQAPWRVGDASDRVGTRLEGPSLERAVTGELTSEPVIRGAIQVPTSGVPLIFGPDHPTTGGYPVIGVVDPEDADRLAQARAGVVVRFAMTSHDW